VRLLKALADERRLRVVRRLAAGSATLPALAEEFGVAKTTMHHHLTALRQAGLIRMNLSDNHYSLRESQLEGLSDLLQTYVKRP
jgi:DNA-binding transcriptional ArsR family regulator